MHPLVHAMAAHVAIASLLYLLLTLARAPTVWGWGKRTDGSNPWADYEPRISANLSNQFEWPLLFHVACLVLIGAPPSPASVVLAWIFVGGRIVHSGVQILTRDVRLRGLVFTINFVAVLGLWAVILVAGSAA